MRTMLLAMVLAALAPLAACGPSGRGGDCPGGRTTDGDCCRSGCACGASCISCSSTCRHLEELGERDAGR